MLVARNIDHCSWDDPAWGRLPAIATVSGQHSGNCPSGNLDAGNSVEFEFIVKFLDFHGCDAGHVAWPLTSSPAAAGLWQLLV